MFLFECNHELHLCNFISFMTYLVEYCNRTVQLRIELAFQILLRSNLVVITFAGIIVKSYIYIYIRRFPNQPNSFKKT